MQSHNVDLGPVMVIRMGRLLRVARCVRLVARFRDLLMLVRGLLHSWSTMIHTCILFMVMIYVFGCLCMELITLAAKDREDLTPEFRENVEIFFPSLPVAMLTVVQFITFDNVVYIYKPMIEADWTLTLLFGFMLLVFGMVLMNLVTAVIVNSALEQAMKDKDTVAALEEEKKRVMMKKLKRVFLRLDKDGSGEVSREEVTSIDDHDREVLRDLTKLDDPGEVFDHLDVDGSGEVDVQEFCKGIEQMAFTDTPIEMRRMERQIAQMYTQMKTQQLVQETLQFALKQLLDELQNEGGRQMSSGDIIEKSHASIIPQNKEPPSPRPPDASAASGAVRPSCVSVASVASTPSQSRAGRMALRPPWTGELVTEIKRTCRKEVRRAVEEANRSLILQVESLAAEVEEHLELTQQKSMLSHFNFPGMPQVAKKGRTSVTSRNNGQRPSGVDAADPPHPGNGGLPADDQSTGSRENGHMENLTGKMPPIWQLRNMQATFTRAVNPLNYLPHAKEDPLTARQVDGNGNGHDSMADNGMNKAALEPWDSSGWSCCDVPEPDPLALPVENPPEAGQVPPPGSKCHGGTSRSPSQTPPLSPASL